MIVGIDLGTTNSLIGAMDSGFPVLFADADGVRLTPSLVGFGDDGEILVGREAEALMAERPERVVYSVKRLMGGRVGEVEDDFAFALKGQRGDGILIETPNGLMSPEEVSACILRKLKADAERVLEAVVDRAVITVPAYFNDAQRSATKRAGELAGFVVERIVSEPTAAALAYGLDKLGDDARVAVFDLGGGTFDISILELSGGVFDVRATDGDTKLGGDDFDRAVAEEFGVLRVEAKAIKESCGSREIGDPVRVRVERVCRPVLERTRGRCERVLSDSKTKPGELAEVILVGGSTRLPMVATFVEEVFGIAPNRSQHPDEAVALGAAIQAGILDGVVQNVTLLDVTPLSLGIETFGGLMNVIIPRNTTIPVKRGEMFTNAVANQTSVRISILQGEREMASDNWKLGEIEVPFSPAPRGQGRVGVQFEIDANGILRVLARDIASGADHTVEIQSAVAVDDAKVEEMVSASVEHAFEDVTARQLAEMRVKVDEMLPAVQAGLAQVGDHLSEVERTRIELLCKDVEAAVGAGNLQRLKKLVKELDDETQNLATILIEAVLGGD